MPCFVGPTLPFISPWIPSPKTELTPAAAAFASSSLEQCTPVLRDSWVREALRRMREPFKLHTALVPWY